MADVLVFQESFLKPVLTFNIPGKIVYRLDRLGGPGGGLLIAVNSLIPSSRLNSIKSDCGNEIMGVCVKLDSLALNIINIYSRSGNVSTDLNRITHELMGPSLLLGDFNLHHPLWGGRSPSRYSENFVDWLSASSYCLINHSDATHVAPSGTRSLIDLSLCSSLCMTKISHSVEDSLYDSDHFPIKLSLDIVSPHIIPRTMFRWGKICENVNGMLEPCTKITYDSLANIISNAMSNNSVQKKTPCKPYPPWWSTRCSNLMQQKKFLLKQATRFISTEWWIKYKKASAKLRKVIKENKRKFWDSVCSDARDPGNLYKIFRKISNREANPPDSQNMILHDGRIITNAIDQANIFAKFFSNADDLDPIPIDFSGDDGNELNQLFSLYELRNAVQDTKVTTPGEDKVSATLFKGLNNHALGLLLGVYNDVWTSGDIPSEWRSAMLLPIGKPGKSRKQIASFRPIALTSVMGKICERMITKRISDHLIKNNLIHNRHFGFLPFRDCQPALVLLHLDINQAKREKKYIVGISLDIQAAYDSVYIDGLMMKCAMLGIKGRCLKWIHGFLSHRSIRVFWRQTVSDRFETTRGVPQGSVLSPVLFTVFMHDFFETLDPDVKGLVYADDIFIYCASDNLDNCWRKLQSTLRDIAVWCRYWKLSIRPDKCHAINLSRRRGECEWQFSISNGLIAWVDELKFLGFYFSRYGGLSKQVTYLRDKAVKRINILKALANKHYGARSYHLVTLATANVCCVTNYGAVILHNASCSLVRKLDVIQNNACRVALGFPKWVPNPVLRKIVKMPETVSRIKNMALSFWIKHSSLREWSPLWQTGYLKSSFLTTYFPHVHETMTELEWSLDNLLGFTAPLPINSSGVQYHLTDLPFQNKELDQRVILPLFNEMVQGYKSEYRIVATDASKSNDLTSIAGCSTDSQFGYRSHNINSIFTAEALALGIALDELIQVDRPSLILTDSLSVLKSLQSVSLKSPDVIIWLHNKIYGTARRIPDLQIWWVPGHRGIPLNEKADKIAKSVNIRDVFIDWVSSSDIIRYKKSKMIASVEDQYRGSKYAGTHGNIPSIKQIHAWSRSRRVDVMISRLVGRMLITPAVLFRFGLVNCGVCGRCGVTDSIDHILFKCAKYQTQRAATWQRLGIDILKFQSFPGFVDAFCGSQVFRIATMNFLFSTQRF